MEEDLWTSYLPLFMYAFCNGACELLTALTRNTIAIISYHIISYLCSVYSLV